MEIDISEFEFLRELREVCFHNGLLMEVEILTSILMEKIEVMEKGRVVH